MSELDHDTRHRDGAAVALHPLVRLAVTAAESVQNRGAASLSFGEMQMVQELIELGFLEPMKDGFTGLSLPAPDIPLGKCTCGDSTGDTGIRCCNICGFPIREEAWQPQFMRPRPFSAIHQPNSPVQQPEGSAATHSSDQ